jgi:hypothetical protein
MNNKHTEIVFKIIAAHSTETLLTHIDPQQEFVSKLQNRVITINYAKTHARYICTIAAAKTYFKQ